MSKAQRNYEKRMSLRGKRKGNFFPIVLRTTPKDISDADYVIYESKGWKQKEK